MDARGLGPWTDFVKLHLDVEAGTLTQAAVAIGPRSRDELAKLIDSAGKRDDARRNWPH